MLKSKLEILEETVAAYTDASNRSFKNGWCSYLSEEGKMCAVGRCMTEPDKYAVPSSGSVLGLDSEIDEEAYTTFSITRGHLQKKLKEEYRGHSADFWLDLQGLHDGDRYFNETTWSDLGLKKIEELRQKHK